MRTWLLVLLLALVPLATHAQTPDVDATSTAVEFAIKVQQPAVSATTAPAVSVGIYDEAAPATNLKCATLASGGTATVNFSLAYSATNPSPRVRARAYAGANCSGLVSPASANAGRVTFLVASPSFVP